MDCCGPRAWPTLDQDCGFPALQWDHPASRMTAGRRREERSRTTALLVPAALSVTHPALGQPEDRRRAEGGGAGSGASADRRQETEAASRRFHCGKASAAEGSALNQSGHDRRRADPYGLCAEADLARAGAPGEGLADAIDPSPLACGGLSQSYSATATPTFSTLSTRGGRRWSRRRSIRTVSGSR
jgi:hypothetical protein